MTSLLVSDRTKRVRDKRERARTSGTSETKERDARASERARDKVCVMDSEQETRSMMHTVLYKYAASNLHIKMHTHIETHTHTQSYTHSGGGGSAGSQASG